MYILIISSSPICNMYMQHAMSLCKSCATLLLFAKGQQYYNVDFSDEPDGNIVNQFNTTN